MRLKLLSPKLGFALTSVFLTCTACDKEVGTQSVKSTALGGSSAFFAFANSPGSNANALVQKVPDSKMSAFYLVSVQGVPLGTAVAAQNELDTVGPAQFEMRLLHRVGHATLVTTYSGKLESEKNEVSYNSKISVTDNDKEIAVENLLWNVNGTALQLKAGSPSRLPALFGLALDGHTSTQNMVWNAQTATLFFKRVGLPAAQAVLFSPLTGETFSDQVLNAKYEADGFLKEAVVPWYGGIQLEFTRMAQADLAIKAEHLGRTPSELAWFSSEGKLRNDFRQLGDDAESCLRFATDAERMVKREFPQLPYLVHRKLFNVRNLCELVSFELKRGNSSAAPFAALDKLMKPVRVMLTEDRRELPRSFVSSPEIDVLNDDTRRWQWAKIISHLIRKTHEEMFQILSIEQSQKANVNLKISIDKLTPGSIAKGTLRLQSSVLTQVVDLANDKKMKPQSWTAIPDLVSKNIKLALTNGSGAEKLSTPRAPSPFELLNGQSFASGEVTSLGSICEQYQGRVGLDLGNSEGRILSSNVVRGVWDESTRLELVREFARRAMANPACKSLVVRVPAELLSAAKAELDVFRKDILQTESEFQITNGSSRRIRLAPGTYELVLSSLVNGNVLGKRLIIIPEGKDNLQVITAIH